MPRSRTAPAVRALLFALVRPRPEILRDAAAHLGAADWRVLLDLCERHGLTPLAHARLAEAGEKVPVDADRLLAKRRAEHAFAADRRRTVLRQLAEELAPLRVPLVLYKGGAYAFHLYADPGLRPMGDLDLLVRAADAGLVERRLLEIGFVHGPRYARFTHERVFLRPPDDNVDLHTAFVQAERNAIPYEELFARSRESALHPTFRVLDPIDELLAHVVHQGTHELAVSLLTFADLALLAERSSALAGTIAARARDWRIQAMLAASGAVCRRDFAFEVPGAPRSFRSEWPLLLPSPEQLLELTQAPRPLQLARKALLCDRPIDFARFAGAQLRLLIGGASRAPGA